MGASLLRNVQNYFMSTLVSIIFNSTPLPTELYKFLYWIYTVREFLWTFRNFLRPSQNLCLISKYKILFPVDSEVLYQRLLYPAFPQYTNFMSPPEFVSIEEKHYNFWYFDGLPDHHWCTKNGIRNTFITAVRGPLNLIITSREIHSDFSTIHEPNTFFLLSSLRDYTLRVEWDAFTHQLYIKIWN